MTPFEIKSLRLKLLSIVTTTILGLLALLWSGTHSQSPITVTNYITNNVLISNGTIEQQNLSVAPAQTLKCPLTP